MEPQENAHAHTNWELKFRKEFLHYNWIFDKFTND